MQTILGANGTIGTLLAKELRNYTDRVRLVSRTPKKIDETNELFPADLTDPAHVRSAIAGSDVTYLVVGFDYNLKIWQREWPKLMRATIDACIANKSKLVFFDNVYMYEKKAISHMTEESPVDPPSKKGMVRKTIADMLQREVQAGNLTALIARSADFYGPDNNKSMLIELVYKNLIKGKRPQWLIDPDKKHSFTFTPDAAGATAMLGNTPDAYGQTWHLPTDHNTQTGRSMVDLFTKEMNIHATVNVLPLRLLKLLGLFMPLMREMVEMMYQYDRNYFFDSTKFDTRFGFKATTYGDGVRRIIERS